MPATVTPWSVDSSGRMARRREQRDVDAARGEQRRKAAELDDVAEALLAEQHQPLAGQRLRRSSADTASGW